MEDLTKLSDEELAERNTRAAELRIAARSEQVRINAEMDRRVAEKKAHALIESLTPEQLEVVRAKLQAVGLDTVVAPAGAPIATEGA